MKRIRCLGCQKHVTGFIEDYWCDSCGQGPFWDGIKIGDLFKDSAIDKHLCFGCAQRIIDKEIHHI